MKKEFITKVFEYRHSLPGRYYLAISSIGLDEKEFEPEEKVKVTIETIDDMTSSEDKYINKILNIKEKDLITDLVTNDGDRSSYRKVTRRMKILSEWGGGRLILVDMPNGYELRMQSLGGGFVKEGWCTHHTMLLSDDEIKKINEIINYWM